MVSEAIFRPNSIPKMAEKYEWTSGLWGRLRVPERLAAPIQCDVSQSARHKNAAAESALHNSGQFWVSLYNWVIRIVTARRFAHLRQGL